MNKWTLIIATFVLGFAFTGCEDAEDAAVFKAQDCINNLDLSGGINGTYTGADVNNCIAGIASATSSRALRVRCAAAFLSEGIDNNKIVAAVEEIDSGATSSFGRTTPAINALQMSDQATADAALAICTSTGSTTLTSLASFANIATATVVFLQAVAQTQFGGGIDSNSIEQVIRDYNSSTNVNPPTAQQLEDLGSSVIALQDGLCDPDTGIFEGTEACDDINAAITSGGGNPSTVANQLLQQIEAD